MSGSQTYMQLLGGNRPFRRLLAGHFASELGNWFNFIAALGLVRHVSNASAEAASLVLIARLAPFALFAPVAGALVDRMSRRTVMMFADAGRAVVALGFLFVRDADNLWIAYLCTIAATILAAFFEAAKNGAVPNIAGEEGLLAGNGLMFSSRFLLMSIGAALGGVTVAQLGYEAAFGINAISFVVSALAIWRIPAHLMHCKDNDAQRASSSLVIKEIELTRKTNRVAEALKVVGRDLREGWSYIASHKLVSAIIAVNILWATGGGAINLVYDRLGGVTFAGGNTTANWDADTAVSILYAAAGVGMFIGMFAARKVGAWVEAKDKIVAFIGWTLIAHGLVFALCGVVPGIWLCALMILISRIIIGVEFAVQETLMMRLLPDNLRGRVFTTDRAAEIAVMSVVTGIGGWSLQIISPRTLAVISGLLAATPGVLWLALFATNKLQMPTRFENDAQVADLTCDEALAIGK